MHQHGELSGHGCDRAFESVLAAALGDLQAPLAERRVLAEAPKDVVGALVEQLADILIAGLGDVKLWIAVTRLALLGPQTQERADIAAVFKALGAAQR